MSVLFLRSLGGAFGDVPQERTAFPARDATWFAMAGAFDIPGLVDDESRPVILTAWDAIEALGDGVYGNFTHVDRRRLRRQDVPARDDGAPARGQAASGTRANVFSRNHNVRPELTRPGAARPRSVRVFGFDLGAVARPQGVEGALLVDALVGVRAEEVALALHQGGGQPVGAEAVVVRQR